MAAKKQWHTEDDFSKSALTWKFCDISQNFYLYHILNNEDFKMEVEQTKFCDTCNNYSTKLLYYWLARNPSVKIWSNKFQMVMIKLL